ncbi:MAG: cytochrome c-type biogenesis protein CcmH [Gammaproteobacteria bacterium]|nr:cytochrome c-type biogenesis protein CcmH [Gammaproteobacteria bacterium]
MIRSSFQGLGIVRAALLALALWASSPAAQAIDPVELQDPALQERYRALTHELRCMQCQNQSIADSPVGLAGDLRREVRELLLAGKTDAEVREHLSARYGDFILFRPRFTAATAWLWITPAALLLLGIVIAARIIRRRATLADSDPTEPDDRGDARA